MGRRVAFLDSDGVLNEAVIENGKPVAPKTVADLVIPAEVRACTDRLKAAGYLVICITNKPDVDDGRMTMKDVKEIFAKVTEEAGLDDLFACFHRDADCFKPKPGLLLEAKKKYDVDMENSFFVGDRWSDIAAGKAAGTKTIWIDRGYAKQETPDPAADFTTNSLTGAIDWVLGEKS